MIAGGWTLNVLSMGDHEAETLGVDPRRARRILLATATMATAVSESSVGVVPWVGLMTPHATRLLLGPDNRFVVPGSALMGALILLACDTAARSLTSSEIPVGIVTALAGGPFLAYLVRQRTAGLFGSTPCWSSAISASRTDRCRSSTAYRSTRRPARCAGCSARTAVARPRCFDAAWASSGDARARSPRTGTPWARCPRPSAPG